MSNYTWLLDPGHGGIINGVYQTSGKRSPYLPDCRILYEGEFNRDVVQRLVSLCKNADIAVVNLVDTNEDTPLRKRVEKANLLHNQTKNTIYLSIHANAYGDGKSFNSVHGASTFHHYKSRTGKRLAEVLQHYLAEKTQFRDRGVKCNDSWANFYILRKTHMPAILSENGFMTNLRDVEYLLDPQSRVDVAQAHFDMIKEIEEDGL